MRPPAWMVAYAVALVLLGTGVLTVVFVGTRAALFFTVPALAAMLIAVYLTYKR